MSISNSLITQICIHQLIFYNPHNKTLINIKGRVRKDESAIIVWPKNHMRFYGTHKVVCMNNCETAKEYQVIGLDRDQRLEAQDNQNRPYVLFISKK